MVKHQSILKLLDRLNTLITDNGLEIVDNWDADLCAIGLQRDTKLIFISTYGSIDKDTVLYDYDLELLGEGYQVIKAVNHATEQELIAAIQDFFGV
ncbi:MAG: hypothetical protein ACTHJ0_07975 [Flavipsychrobacter sp.]